MLKKSVLLVLVILAMMTVSIVSAGESGEAPLSATQMTRLQGDGFWEGLVCGAAFAGIGVAGIALAAPTAGMGTAVALSLALHVSAVCALS